MQKLDAILALTSSVKPPPSVPQPPIDPALWDEAVGTRIARRAQPIRLERGVLYVRVATSAWANELSMLADDILAQLMARNVAATSLRFSVGPIKKPRRRRGKPRHAAAPDAALPEMLRDRVAKIEDPNLQRALAEACAKSLSVSRRNG